MIKDMEQYRATVAELKMIEIFEQMLVDALEEDDEE